MFEYHKIQTLFKRDPVTKHKTLLEDEYSLPEFEYLKDNQWVFTEKVDGTNIRVHLSGGNGGAQILFGGRTDNAQMPPFLYDRLNEIFTNEVVSKWQQANNVTDPVTLYGEGYGAKIQNGGGDYIPDGVGFILFDVYIRGIWLDRHNVEDVAYQLSIPVVPIIGTGKLDDAVQLVKNGFASRLRDTPPEGIVMRPAVELLNRRLGRVISKLKLKDFDK